MIDRRFQAQYPEQPWLWLRGWFDKRIHHSHLKDGAALLGFALVWNAIVATIAFFGLKNGDAGAVKWVIVFFAAVGVVLLWGAVRAVIIGLRFPRSTLLLNAVPQPLGRKFSARLEAGALPEGDIWTSLSCVRRPAANVRHTLWREERQVSRASVHRTPNGWIVPVEFELPARGEETRDLGLPGEVSWILSVGIGKKEAPLIRGQFLIPVFGGGAVDVDEFDQLLAALPDDLRRKIENDIKPT